MTLSQHKLTQLLTNPVRYYGSVDSTNDLAKQWLIDGGQAFSIIVADEQRKGRGRKGRFWYTPPGVALAVSMILKPTPQQASRMSMVGALAVAELCDSVGVQDVGIKWPNDVQISGKKVSGILPEAVWQDGQLLGVVLGMGVNVRVQFEGELAQTATSLETVCGCALDRSELVTVLAERVRFWMQQPDATLVKTWQSRLNTLGREVWVEDVVGKAVAVDESGALLIETQDGTMQRVLAGDLSLLPPQDEDE